MASISRQPNGRKTIPFIAGDKRRKSIRLGKVPVRFAETVKSHVEHLSAASITGHPIDRETAKWVAGLDDSLAEKLAAVGLIPKRENPKSDGMTLEAFVNRYISNRTDVKSSTATVWKRTRRHLLAFFGSDHDIRTVTAGDAKDFRLYLMQLKDDGLADNTVRRTCGIAKQFFEDAVDREIITKNPFKHRDIPTSTGGNVDRMHFITTEDAKRIIDNCPDAEWRLIIALSRYGGLYAARQSIFHCVGTALIGRTNASA